MSSFCQDCLNALCPYGCQRIFGNISVRDGNPRLRRNRLRQIQRRDAIGEGDFDGIFETLREMDFASKQLKTDAERKEMQITPPERPGDRLPAAFTPDAYTNSTKERQKDAAKKIGGFMAEAMQHFFLKKI